MILSSVESLRQAVHESLQDPTIVCVFPTETAVRFWIEDFVMNQDEGIVRADRLMAWDAFRASFLPTSDLFPANRMIRMLFARKLLSDETSRHMLRWFRHADPSHTSENLDEAIAASLPLLQEIEQLRLTRETAYNRLPREYRADIAWLSFSYREFLEEHGLFEPRFLLPSAQHAEALRGMRYRVFFPEVCEGWVRFRAMRPFPDWIEACEIEASSVDSSLELFPNELAELRGALSEVASLLDHGTSSRDILITVGNLERWRPYLEHEAVLQDVPLSIAGGRPILLSSPGRFLRGLLELSASRFSIGQMRSLFLDPRIPWKDRATHRHLIRRGIELCVEQGHEHPVRDGWIVKLGVSAQKGDRLLLEWYRMLRSLAGTLVKASSVEDLVKALHALQQFLLADGRWTGAGSLEYAYCLDQLQELKRVMRRCSFVNMDRLYSLFLQFLSRQTYVSPVRSEGVPVYPYSVSVGMCPAHHFVLGCTLEGTRMEPQRLALLGEHVWEEELEEDRTESFLDHYRVSGTRVGFSASRTIFGNTSALVPSWFIDHDAIREFSRPCDDIQQRELEAWGSDSPEGFIANHMQSRQFNRARISACTLARLDMAIRSTVVPIHVETPLPLSATELDRYFSCPMKWVSSHLLHLEKGNFDIRLIDHAAIGIKLHQILERFFREVQRTTETWRSSCEEQYRQSLVSIIDEVFVAYGRSAEAPSRTTMNYIRSRYTRQLMDIITAESRMFDGFGSLGFEHAITSEEEGCSLFGRIDRILVRQEPDGSETVALVDYKKRHGGSTKAYAEDPARMPSRQLPLYAKLLAQVGIDGRSRDVAIGAFYDISGGKYIPIWEQGETAVRDALIEAVTAHIRQMIDDLQEGRLGATPSKQSCSFCDFRQICRRRYALV